MNELRPVLDELAATAPVDRADWSDVVGRARGRRHQARPRKRLALAVALGAVLSAAGTAIAIRTDLLTQVERFHAQLPDDPQRISPAVEIATGEDWALVGWRSENGICLDFAVPGNAAFDCDFPVRGAKPASNRLGAGLPTHVVGGFISFSGLVGGGDSKTSIFGVAADNVGAVAIELRDGRTLKPQLYRAPPELGATVKFFIIRLPLAQPTPGTGSPVRFYTAYNREGEIIERVRD
jgi:hypothetical protein